MYGNTARLVLGIFLFIAGSGWSMAENDQLDFKLVNRTGVEIHAVYISPADTNKWGADVLGQDVLADGETCEITFDSGEEAEEWDLKIEDEEGAAVVWTGLDLTEIRTLTLKIVKGDPVAEIK